MSLSAREQQALAGIEDSLAGSDPGLAARLAIFARLTAGEDMPAQEEIPARNGRADAWLYGSCPGRAWSLACTLIWLAASVSMIATALTLN